MPGFGTFLQPDGIPALLEAAWAPSDVWSMAVQDVLVLSNSTIAQTGVSYGKPRATSGYHNYYVLWTNACDDGSKWKMAIDIWQVELGVPPELPPAPEPEAEP